MHHFNHRSIKLIFGGELFNSNKYSRVYILSRVRILSLYDFELIFSAEA